MFEISTCNGTVWTNNVYEHFIVQKPEGMSNSFGTVRVVFGIQQWSQQKLVKSHHFPNQAVLDHQFCIYHKSGSFMDTIDCVGKYGI